ncbi:MAG: YlqD family protein [Selenomonas sp.]|uniref:YlqD family protein n=1 Tax=Selenomonas sp. TaxID=2053611 RepID=UPI0025FB4CD9|nr:YlqD family protein [Selenomonas sp.]MCR5756440.1 YlqD family protein [Selenomonas sp.]
MDSISLKVPVTIKAKLTEKLKNKILTDLDEAIKRTDLELQQMDIQQKRVLQENQPANPEQPTVEEVQRYQAIQAHFGEERQKRLQFKAESEARKEEMEHMVIGAEIVQGTLEHQVEVHVGDDMREIMNVEVLVEDDKVIAIRS